MAIHADDDMNISDKYPSINICDGPRVLLCSISAMMDGSLLNICQSLVQVGTKYFSQNLVINCD